MVEESGSPNFPYTQILQPIKFFVHVPTILSFWILILIRLPLFKSPTVSMATSFLFLFKFLVMGFCVCLCVCACLLYFMEGFMTMGLWRWLTIPCNDLGQHKLFTWLFYVVRKRKHTHNTHTEGQCEVAFVDCNTYETEKVNRMFLLCFIHLGLV